MGGAVGDDGAKMMGEDVGDSGRGRVGMTTQWWAWLCGRGRSQAAPRWSRDETELAVETMLVVEGLQMPVELV